MIDVVKNRDVTFNQCKNNIHAIGTDPKDVVGDGEADASLLAGLGSDQLKQAAEYYLQVKAANPSAKITLTGHSLGGGLAALVAVFFNETALTFDQAPFRNSGSALVANSVRGYLADRFLASALAQLDKFISSFDPLGLGWSQDGLAARSANVSNLSVQGEVASAVNALKIGKELSPLTHGSYFGPVDVHSQALLSAFLQSEQAASGKQTLSEATKKLTDLLPMIFDKGLYAFPTDTSNTTNRNFLENLVRHQAGGIGGIPVGGDAMVARFTKDLWLIAQDGGLTMSNVKRADGLSAFAMQKYYDETSYRAGYGKVLYTAVYGGLHFKLSDVAGSLDTAKGYTLYLKDFFATLPGAEATVVTAELSGLNDWYFQAGANAMTATAGSQAAFMLGWSCADTLTGGAANDPVWRMAA